jgi:membrane protein involved in colicin uptake
MLAQNTKKIQQQSDVIKTSSTCKRKKEHKTAEEMQNTRKKSDENDGNRKHEKCSILKYI